MSHTEAECEGPWEIPDPTADKFYRYADYMQSFVYNRCPDHPRTLTVREYLERTYLATFLTDL